MTISNYTEGSGAFSFSALWDVYLIFLGGEYSPDNFPTNHATSKIIFVTIIFFNQSPWCIQNAFLYSISFFFFFHAFLHRLYWSLTLKGHICLQFSNKNSMMRCVLSALAAKWGKKVNFRVQGYAKSFSFSLGRFFVSPT